MTYIYELWYDRTAYPLPSSVTTSGATNNMLAIDTSLVDHRTETEIKVEATDGVDCLLLFIPYGLQNSEPVLTT